METRIPSDKMTTPVPKQGTAPTAPSIKKRANRSSQDKDTNEHVAKRMLKWLRAQPYATKASKELDIALENSFSISVRNLLQSGQQYLIAHYPFG